MRIKRNLIIAVFAILALGACKKKTTTIVEPGTPLTERMVGKWDITGVTYSGVSPLPWDTTVILPFSGVGENVVGFYDFGTDPDTNHMDFESAFTAPLNFDGGILVTITVNEHGWAIYEVSEDETEITGTSYVINPQSIDTVPTVWKVLENYENKQVWETKRSIPMDNDPTKFVVVDMVTTIER